MGDPGPDDGRNRADEAHDVIVPSPLRRLAATFDAERLCWPEGDLPPLCHWLFFLPHASQSSLGPDGHPERSGILSSVTAPRRMWAGGTLEFLKPIPVMSKARKRSIVESVENKQGRVGPLTFVTIRHDVFAEDEHCLIERQNLVFLEGPPRSAAGQRSDRPSEVTRRVTLDITALFRFSALIFNAHRIHYDLDYARGVEGYAGLVVHGPLQAMLLMHHLTCEYPGVRLRGFSFRAIRPLILGDAFELRLAKSQGGVDLWIVGPEGFEHMEARATLAQGLPGA